MTRNEWNTCDYQDYYLYEEAYYERLHETSHIEGRYFYTALSSIVSCVLNKEKNKQIPYPDTDFLTQYRDQEGSKDNNITHSKSLRNMTIEERNEYRTNKLKQLY